MTMATTVRVRAGDKAAMLSALRSAGVVGMTREELVDAARVSGPSLLAERLREDGHSICEETESVRGEGATSALTTRFTLMVDADPQQPLLEGERGQLGTWREASAWDR